MCGICGFAGLGDRAALEAMNARQAHRGPDGAGFWRHARRNVGFGHRRLAIIDVASGAQPMSTADGGLTVTFNGEIYNHAELRAELEAKGHRFQTHHCDTEVLLHGYREWGEAMPERLSGMWAFCIHDAGADRLFLSRDRFGKKPLYYHLRPGLFAFASELTALLAHPEVPASVSALALRKYFAHGFIPAPNSLYEGVYKLPGGHNLTVDLSDFSGRVSRYWAYRVEPMEALPRDPEAEWAEQIRDLLDKAVARRLMSDVPLGVFLSGGVDSSSVTALAARRVQGLRTFSIGFEEASFDESAHSLRAAQLYGTQHRQDTLGLGKALDLLPDLAARLDEPMGDSSLLPTYLLCRETRPHVTVALGGDGADELFAGYDPFKALAAAEAYAALCPKPVHMALRMLAARLPVGHSNMHVSFKVNRFLSALGYPKPLWNPVWLGPVEPRDLPALLAGPCDPEEVYSEAIAAWEETGPKDLVDKTLEFYARFYLQDAILTKVDRASMLCSLEVRAPYLDADLVELVRRIPHRFKFRGGTGKYILKKALEPLVPAEILDRKKKGFGAPVGLWFHQGRLAPDLAALPRGVDRAWAAARLEEHRRGRADHRLLLWNLWVLGRHRGRSTESSTGGAA
ncbi:asparagine synthase (glutamine-hydrolyzing) [Fundidesulfovibrio soli]|uniref:asparagine synthase (glutamine-hydrolyzing) n=1 Tax=Fundidesulfovibrio soli TaxID=2922716 RepID=UPI001FAF7990|nr:asparagine synthase (glutamine-hydrolyzing) [Fundidesulfovibrio soli]